MYPANLPVSSPKIVLIRLTDDNVIAIAVLC